MDTSPYSQRLLKDLVADAQEHDLVLFLGSGVNSTAIRQWNDLLASLLKRAIHEAGTDDGRIRAFSEPLQRWCSDQLDVCAQASLAKQILGPDRYRIEIQDALYATSAHLEDEVVAYCKDRSSGKAEPDDRFEALWTTARLACAPQVRAVATFNFDTLLERAIEALSEEALCEEGLCKKTPRAYFGEVASVAGALQPRLPVLPIFHVHGLLSPPQTMLRNTSESVVFSLDEYFERNADPLSWETATPLHLLRHFCTLWLGASLKDWNMLRLLHAANHQGSKVRSYCLQSLQGIDSEPFLGKQSPDAQEFQQLALRLQATLLKTVGVHLAVVGERYSDIPAAIENLILPRLAGSDNSAPS